VRIQAVIEICWLSNGHLPTELIQHAYKASKHGLIILVLRDIDPGLVDQALDEVVSQLPLTLPGVLYVPAENDIAVREALTATDVVFYSTKRFKDLVQRFNHHGTVLQSVEFALISLKQHPNTPTDGS
jgi:hypothetical protein